MSWVKKAVFWLVFLWAVPAFSVDAPSTKVVCAKAANGSYNILNGVALNAAAASRTLTVKLDKNWAKARIKVFHDFATSGAVSMTVTGSQDEGATFASVTTRSCTAGSCAIDNLVDTYTPATDVTKFAEYDIRTLDFFRIVFSEPGSDSTDPITVQACFSTGE